MKRTLGQTICSILLFAFALTPSAFAQEAPLTFESSLQVELSLKERMIHRRAVEAAVWGMPLMNFKAMRDALKEAGSGFNVCGLLFANTRLEISDCHTELCIPVKPAIDSG